MDQPPHDGEAGHEHVNSLIHETSPYLLQHAHNPIDWHPWGPEAFELARKQNKPIFLSVGYSTCYWCHVMERESFENEEVARVINENFIPIKVDREERPDVDEQYMLATQLMTGRGGWPNSVWLTPDGRPWMAGTYFPRERFVRVLRSLTELWNEQPDDVEQQAQVLANAIEQYGTGPQGLGDRELSPELLRRSLDRMTAEFDRRHGGFGGAPKFPPHGRLRLLARELQEANSADLSRMLTVTLDAMWRGGIHDHIGGGFHRYATDDRWFLPHFEKMLYDNSQLMRVYADAYAATGEERYRHAVAEVFGWLQREMTHPEGGFYSAIDSESEAEEGRFYVWSMGELEDVLGRDDAELFADVYGFDPRGNFVEEATGHRPGTSIPHLRRPIHDVAAERGMQAAQLETRLATLRDKLLLARNQRPRPHLDDKILAGWNGLMIAALARAGDALGEPRFTQAAETAARCVLDNMSHDGQLLRSWREGEATLPAYLDDYAYFIDALIELHVATEDEHWLTHAQSLARTMLDSFQDTQHGGFFFTSDDHMELIVRSKHLTGGGNIPSPNGVAAQVLLRLGRFTGNDEYTQAAERTLHSLSGVMAQSPGGLESLLLATDMYLDDSLSREPAATLADGDADAVHSRPPISTGLYSSKLKVAPGETFSVAVRVDIEEGWHLYGPNPDVDFLIPTTITLGENAPFTAGELQRPEGIVKEDPVLELPLEVYEGDVWFRLPVTVPENTPLGQTDLEVVLHSQACDDNRCLPPRRATLKLPIEVVAEPSDEERHPNVFSR